MVQAIIELAPMRLLLESLAQKHPSPLRLVASVTQTA
jgi:hypothetical protein